MYYFAYGVTLDEEEMLFRCPDSRFVGNGILENYRFIINELGDPTVIRDDSAGVYGVVWDIHENRLKDLDHWEEADNAIFTREMVPISLYNITLENVFIYIAVNSTPGRPRTDYMDTIIAAGTEYCFPPEYIDHLRTWADKLIETANEPPNDLQD